MNAKAKMRTKMGEALCSPVQAVSPPAGAADCVALCISRVETARGLLVQVAADARARGENFDDPIEALSMLNGWTDRARSVLGWLSTGEPDYMTWPGCAVELVWSIEGAIGGIAGNPMYAEVVATLAGVRDDLEAMREGPESTTKSAKGVRTKSGGAGWSAAFYDIQYDIDNKDLSADLRGILEALDMHDPEATADLANEALDRDDVPEDTRSTLEKILRMIADGRSARVRTKSTSAVMEALRVLIPNGTPETQDLFANAMEKFLDGDIDGALDYLVDIYTDTTQDPEIADAADAAIQELSKGRSEFEKTTSLTRRKNSDLVPGLIDEAIDAAEAAGDTTSVGLLQDLRRAADAGLWQEALDLAEAVSGVIDVGALIDALQAQVDDEIISEERSTGVETKSLSSAASWVNQAVGALRDVANTGGGSATVDGAIESLEAIADEIDSAGEDVMADLDIERVIDSITEIMSGLDGLEDPGVEAGLEGSQELLDRAIQSLMSLVERRASMRTKGAAIETLSEFAVAVETKRQPKPDSSGEYFDEDYGTITVDVLFEDFGDEEDDKQFLAVRREADKIASRYDGTQLGDYWNFEDRKDAEKFAEEVEGLDGVERVDILIDGIPADEYDSGARRRSTSIETKGAAIETLSEFAVAVESAKQLLEDGDRALEAKYPPNEAPEEGPDYEAYQASRRLARYIQDIEETGEPADISAWFADYGNDFQEEMSKIEDSDEYAGAADAISRVITASEKLSSALKEDAAQLANEIYVAIDNARQALDAMEAGPRRITEDGPIGSGLSEDEIEELRDEIEGKIEELDALAAQVDDGEISPDEARPQVEALKQQVDAMRRDRLSMASADVETKSSAQDIEELLSCAGAARDIGENAISGGRQVVAAAEALMDELNGDLDPDAVQDAIGDLIDELNGVEPSEDYVDDVEPLQQELADYGRRFGETDADEDRYEGDKGAHVETKKRGDPYKDFTSVLRKLSKGYNGIISATPVEMWDDAKVNDPALYEALKEIEDVTNFMGDIGSVDAWAVDDVMAVVNELKGKLDAVEVEDSDLQAAIDAVVSNWEEVIPELEEAIEAIDEYENRSARVETKSSVSPSLILNELLAFADVPGATEESIAACEELAASLEQDAQDPTAWADAAEGLTRLADRETANDAVEYLLDVASKCAEYSESLGEKSAELTEKSGGGPEWEAEYLAVAEAAKEYLATLDEEQRDAQSGCLEEIARKMEAAVENGYDRTNDVGDAILDPYSTVESLVRNSDSLPENAEFEALDAAIDVARYSHGKYRKSALLTTKSSSIGDFAQQALDRLQEVRDDEDFPVSDLVGKLSTLVAASEIEGVDPAYAEEASSEISDFKYDVNDLELEDLLSQLIEALDERAAASTND